MIACSFEKYTITGAHDSRKGRINTEDLIHIIINTYILYFVK